MNKTIRPLLMGALAALFVSIASAVPLTVGQALEIKANLAALDGHTQIVPQGESSAVVPQAYKFSSDTRWKIAGAIAALKVVSDRTEIAFAEIRKRLGLEKDPKNEALRAQANAEGAIHLARNVEPEVKLPTITRAELNLNDNPIPGSVLAALSPIITDK